MLPFMNEPGQRMHTAQNCYWQFQASKVNGIRVGICGPVFVNWDLDREISHTYIVLVMRLGQETRRALVQRIGFMLNPIQIPILDRYFVWYQIGTCKLEADLRTIRQIGSLSLNLKIRRPSTSNMQKSSEIRPYVHKLFLVWCQIMCKIGP